MRSFFAMERKDGLLEIRGQDARHIASVLRMKPKDALTAVLPAGDRAYCVIESISEDTVLMRPVSVVKDDSEAYLRITLLQAIPKGQKMDYIVEKCTELGFSRIVPVISRYCVAREASSGKLNRWRSLAHEAAKQSGRGSVPEVSDVTSLEAALSEAAEGGAFIIFLWENEKLNGLSGCAGSIKGAGDVVLVVGPEGGFSEEEAELARAKGAYVAGLGPRILRTETAPVAAGAVVLYIAGELGPRIE